jgi:predicted mannosyl-3-phosphoglycerate phosphatase (HAD superfamily)
LRQTSSVVYLAIDELLPSRGQSDPGLEEFLGELAHAAIPCVWLTRKTRLQIDEPRRKLGHRDPFIAEDGCGVFLPEDYFHLRPQAARAGAAKGGGAKVAATVRLGRFTCLPVAAQQPAAAEALESLAAETGVSVVPLSSLPPRQLSQNTGLHPREAELARQRDFDELFFFAGASSEQVQTFQAAAQAKGMQIRQQGALWSLAIGASGAKCIRELAKLFDRALHAHAKTVGIAVGEQPEAFFSACDRSVLLSEEKEPAQGERQESGRGRVLRVPINSSEKWASLTSALLPQR